MAGIEDLVEVFRGENVKLNPFRKRSSSFMNKKNIWKAGKFITDKAWEAASYARKFPAIIKSTKIPKSTWTAATDLFNKTHFKQLARNTTYGLLNHADKNKLKVNILKTIGVNLKNLSPLAVQGLNVLTSLPVATIAMVLKSTPANADEATMKLEDFAKLADEAQPKEEKKEKEMMAAGGNVPSTDIKDYYRRAWGLGDRVPFKHGGTWADWKVNYEDQMSFEEYLQDDVIVKKLHALDKADGGRIGFDEGTKPVITKEKFIELRTTHKNKTNTEFAEILNKDWKPRSGVFDATNVSKRIKDYKLNLDYKGSNVERAVTEKKMIEFWGEENYQKHKKNFSDKKLKNKYTTDKNYKELSIEKKQEKSKKALVLKKKKLAAMDADAREAFIAKEAEESAARTRKKRGQLMKFNKNPRNFKSILWGNLVDRTYQNMWDSPFKFTEESLKLIKSKPELNRVDMEKITLIDKNNKPFTWDTLESYVKEGNALNSKGRPMSWDEVIKSYKIKEFINQEGLAQKINKALIPNYDPVKDIKRSGWHISHNTSFKDGPWETHIAPARANIQEGQARKKFLNLWDGSNAEFKEGKITKEKRFELRKKAVSDYYKTMEPITEIKYGLSKKQHGAATPIEELFKKAGIKLNSGQIKKAQVFLRSALNKGQDISKFLPKITRGGAAALDYSLFHFIFGVPGPTAAMGAATWLTPRPVGDAILAQTQSMSFIDEMNQKKAEDDRIKNALAAHRLKKSQETATSIKPFELDEKKEDNLTGVDQYIINRGI